MQDWSVAHKYNFPPRVLVIWHMEDMHQFAIVKNDMGSLSCEFPLNLTYYMCVPQPPSTIFVLQ